MTRSSLMPALKNPRSRTDRLTKILLSVLTAAMAYAVFGWLSTFLAIPPGYASPVWPAAGIALLAFLGWGRAVTPGIWLGSFFVNCYVGYQATTSLGAKEVGIAAAIGVGAVLQAWYGRYLLRRLFRDRQWLNDTVGNDTVGIVQLLCLSGPLSCLVGASWGNGVLVLAGVIPLSAFADSWLNWWIGDTLGVLAVIPVGTIFLTNPQVSLRPLLAQSSPAILALVLTVILFVSVRTSERTRIQENFVGDTNLLVQLLRAKLSSALVLLDSLEGAFRAAQPDRTFFHIAANHLLERHAGIQALCWVPYVPGDRREALEHAAREAGFSDFQFTERDSGGKLVPAQKRPVYYPVYFIEPLSRNRMALGFDLQSQASRLDALERAAQTGKTTATGYVHLVQDTSGQKAIVVYQPLGQGRSLRGFIGAVIRLDDLTQSALRGLAPNGISLQLLDSTAKVGDRVLADFPQISTEKALLQRQVSFPFANRTWHLEFRGSEKYWLTKQTQQPWLVLTGGFFFTSLMGAFILSLTRRTILVEQLVVERTSQLALAKEAALKAAADADAASLSKSNFLAVMSHEIRTPMNGVLGMTDLLLDTPLNATPRDYANTIRASGTTLLNILNDILDFSKIESNRLELEHLPLCINICVRDVLNLFANQARDKGIQLVYMPGPELPEWISGDATRFQQILLNLVGNAMKFTDRGEVVVRAVWLPKTGLHETGLQLAISDTGIGIAPDRLESLFEPFTQADSSIARRYGGTGLGLAICKRLCDLMGGRIWVETQEGKGSTFYFTIAAQAIEPPVVGVEPVPVPSMMAGDMPLSILIAEDNPVNRKVALMYLQKLGYQADAASSGLEVLELLQQRRYDIILMDIQMPDMDGLETTHRIVQAFPASSRPYIIALTAQIGESDRDRCLQSGMSDFVSKPFKLSVLENALRKAAKTLAARTNP